MDETGVALRRPQHQQPSHQFLLTPPTTRSFVSGASNGGGGSRLMRESSGEGVSSSDDEHLAGETVFEARVCVHSRKKSSKGLVSFEQDSTDRVLQLQGDQLKLKKKDKVKAKIFVYYVWVRRNISDYVPKDSHRIRDESLAILAGWYKDLMIVTFATNGEKELFLVHFQKVNAETLLRLYGDDSDPSEQCEVRLGCCIPVESAASSPQSAADGASSMASSGSKKILTVKPYETANDVALKCKTAFKLDSSLRVHLCLEGSSGHCMAGCESIFATVLYHIHDKHKSERRRGSMLSEASSTSPNDSNSMDLDESFARDVARVKLSLHSQDTCTAGACSSAKKKKQPQHQHQHQHQSRRASEVPSKIRSWLASSRRSQLVRQGSVEALAVSGGAATSCGSTESSPIIGRPLAELFPSGTVSRPITCLLAQIYHRCYAAKGIFRQPGSVAEKNQVLQLISQYDLVKQNNLPQLNSFGEHCIADALKHYLRSLPDNLLQKNLADQWSRIGQDLVEERVSQQEAVAQIRHVIQQMQPQNAHLLHMLMTALCRVASNQQQNQMTAANIGRSVSFSVLDQSSEGANLAAMEQEAQRVIALIELMIASFSDIWPDARANQRALEDFSKHICQSADTLSSTESLTVVDGVSRQAEGAEPLSLSSVSKDSGLQLSDQQLDESRRQASAGFAGPVEIPERQQPPPYEIAMKRQARGQRSRQPQQRQQQQPPPPPPLPYQEVTPRQKQPPVPARMSRRPASVGPGSGSGRQPLPAGFDPMAESKSRHPMVSSANPAAASTGRPVKATPVAASAAFAVAASVAAQHQSAQQQQLQLQPRFRKRSSSETRLELIGLEPASHQQQQHQQHQQQSPFHQPRHQHQHQHQQHSHQHHHQPDGGEAAAQRRQQFERLSRLHTRESFDASTLGGGSRSAPRPLQSQFSSRHAPLRGPALGDSTGSGSSPRLHHQQQQQQQQQLPPSMPRPRTRLPEQLQLRLANQPESLV